MPTYRSTTCSLRNLVTCSAGGYNCTPGGQVIPIIFSMGYLGPSKSSKAQWAPYLALILLPAGSYAIDWTNHLAHFDNINTAPDVSFFEREVSYDTHGGQSLLSKKLFL